MQFGKFCSLFIIIIVPQAKYISLRLAIAVIDRESKHVTAHSVHCICIIILFLMVHSAILILSTLDTGSISENDETRICLL